MTSQLNMTVGYYILWHMIYLSITGGLNMWKMKATAEFTESYEAPSSASFPASIFSRSYATIAERIGNNKFSC